MQPTGTPRPRNQPHAESVVRDSSSAADPDSPSPDQVNRDIFREMIRRLIEDNQLDRKTQREVIDFARHLAIDASEAAAMITVAQREAGLACDPTPKQAMDAATRSVTGVAIIVLLLNAVWFWYILGN
ncbi:MAG: hypothetical protein HBSAPP02_00640 [Phycisphaerae bacterium]|nr:MAG: hypothetical protein HRU71_04580 [Planctomycetia bacterium]RIK70896.1 MAG: hypothetical protein DCC66_03215 [Planctomycetota bacterium]GJQ25032.1 MAG: hypothetical protein HBSAPP02_00640 [Phycisphaerae bacterium]